MSDQQFELATILLGPVTVSKSLVKNPYQTAALKRYISFNTPPRRHLDRIIRLAAASLSMPFSCVSLIGGTRQWLKSNHDSDASWIRQEVTFCSYTVLGKEPLVVSDATADDRFAANPLVTEVPNIRFYAGAPLVTRDGHVLGTLCVMDRSPHPEFGDEQRRLLQDLAGLVMTEIDARSATLALRKKSSDHRETERRLHRISAEKDILSREVHHRVKNNLQAMWGMLQAEAAWLQHHPEARERIKLIAQRIAVLGSIHNQLYTVDNVANVAIDAYLSRLSEMVRSLYPDRSLMFTIEAGLLHCDIDTALPLGLITHELVSNSVKHGFTDGRHGTIRIGLHHRADLSRVILTVEDDGVGSANDHTKTRTGLGLILLNALAEQIDATVEVSDSLGYRTTVSVPNSRFHVAERS
jgi:two-component sensor histidine kinase